MSTYEQLAMRVRGFVKPRMSVMRARYSPLEWYRNHRTDVFLVWFPKTGGTWVRLLLQDAMARHLGVDPARPFDFDSFADADPAVARIRPIHEDEPHWKRPEQLSRSKAHLADKRVLLLARDPRDAMVSLHLQMTRRWKVTDMGLSDYIWQPRGGIETMIEYYNIWAASRDVPRDLLLVRYEDVHADPPGMLRRILGFVGMPAVGEEVVRYAVEHNAIDRLREREQAGEYSTSRLRPGIPGDRESFKARRGKVGGFVDYLAPDDVDRMTRLIADRLDPWYGYPLNMADVDEAPPRDVGEP